MRHWQQSTSDSNIGYLDNLVIREHALLAIRNLMMNNPENQAVVGTMDPIGMVGADGELREMPARLERSGHR